MQARILLIAGSLANLAPSADFLGQGYFQATIGSGTVERYLKIEGDSGFYCIMDDKSSFRFKIIGDSMTTPMNGMDRIVYAHGSGSVQISGVEKGETYRIFFAPRQAGQYPAACVEEEAELYGPGTVGLRRRGPVAAGPGPGRDFDILGRMREGRSPSVRAPRPSAGNL